MTMDVKRVTTDDQKPAAKKASLKNFIRETRQEISKITWPSRRDTIIFTFWIVGMAVVTGLFFLGIDTALGFIISHILGMNS